MKYAVEICSGTMICIPSFIMTGRGIQKLLGRDTHTDNKVISYIYFYFFKIRKLG
jgi:hypothetical protein